MPSIEERQRSQCQAFASAINVAAQTVATMPAIAGQTAYLTGIDFFGGSASTAVIINVAITGLQGGTVNIPIPILAVAVTAVAFPNYPLQVRPPDPVPASAANTAIVATVPSYGTGSLTQSVVLYGFYK